MKKSLIFLIFIFLIGCSQDEIPESLIPTKADAFAKNYILKLTTGQIDYCYNQIPQEYKTEQAREFLLKLTTI